MDSQDTESVFVCQSCSKPLKIVERKGVKSSTLLAFQNDELPPYLDESYKNKTADAVKQLSESFVVLSDSTTTMDRKNSSGGNNTSFHAQVQALTRIFEVVSDQCQIDCPLCIDCNDNVQRQLKDKVREINEETQSFRRSIAELKSRSRGGAAKTASGTDEKEEEERERKLAAEVEKQVEDIRKERERLNAETLKLEEESERLDSFERKFWEEYQEYQLEVAALQEKQGTIQQKIEMTKQQLEQLKVTNVYDDAFYISSKGSKGHFGTINGFKLGRLPAQSVSWDEINAALGQVVLLLSSISKQVRYEFRSVVLHPMGSYSKIADRKKPDVHNELYNYGSNEFFLRQGSSSSSAGKRFNTALSLLLRAVKELGDYAGTVDPTFKLPKDIRGDKIEGKSIQAVAAEVDWTKAMKYMLINLKTLLAWCAKYSATGLRPLRK